MGELLDVTKARTRNGSHGRREQLEETTPPDWGHDQQTLLNGHGGGRAAPQIDVKAAEFSRRDLVSRRGNRHREAKENLEPMTRKVDGPTYSRTPLGGACKWSKHTWQEAVRKRRPREATHGGAAERRGMMFSRCSFVIL